MRTFVTTALSFALIMAMFEIGTAQDRNDRRRQFFEGILKTLIDSQIDPQQQPDNRPPNRPGTRNPKLVASRQTLERFSDESGHLLTALRREEQANPAYRSLLGDVAGIKASADVLMRRDAAISEAQFSSEYQAIDRQWRVASHRLRQIPGFDRGCLAHVEKLNVYDQQICELLNLAPQLDRRELSAHLAEMHGALQTLLEDLDFAVRGQPGAQALLLEGQTLRAGVYRLGQIIEQQNSSHQVVVAGYKQVYARWRAFAIQVKSVNDKYVARRVRRIEATHDAIHELLWIPKQIDRGELLAMLKTFQADVDHVHQGITLDHLLHHASPQDAVASGLALNGSCANLVKALAGQTSLEELAWDFRMLEVEWQTASTQLRSWGEPDLDQRLAAAQRTVDILSQTLGQELRIDHHTVVALVATIHDGADALAAQTVQLVNFSNQYSPAFRASAIKVTKEFQESAHHLHESLARHGSDEHLKRDTIELAKAWDSVQHVVAEFNPQHREFLNRICRPLGPGIAKTQILYAY